MLNLNYLLSDGGLQSDFVTTFFPILRIVLVSLIFLSAIVLILSVLLQSEDASGGTNVISGTRESYYAENKGDSRDGRLKKITIITSIVIGVSSLLYFISLIINSTL